MYHLGLELGREEGSRTRRLGLLWLDLAICMWPCLISYYIQGDIGEWQPGFGACIACMALGSCLRLPRAVNRCLNSPTDNTICHMSIKLAASSDDN